MVSAAFAPNIRPPPDQIRFQRLKYGFCIWSAARCCHDGTYAVV